MFHNTYGIHPICTVVDSSGTELGSVAGVCEHKSEHSTFVRFCKIFDTPKNC